MITFSYSSLFNSYMSTLQPHRLAHRSILSGDFCQAPHWSADRHHQKRRRVRLVQGMSQSAYRSTCRKRHIFPDARPSCAGSSPTRAPSADFGLPDGDSSLRAPWCLWRQPSLASSIRRASCSCSSKVSDIKTLWFEHVLRFRYPSIYLV